MPAEPSTSPPEHVWVYGNDHSPWVQAVLLGLHERGIPRTQVTTPPLSVFLDSGILMPAAKLGDQPWQLDSERILVGLGFPELSPTKRRALGKVFSGAAQTRTDNVLQFLRCFSWTRDGHPKTSRRLWNQFCKSFSIFYFFTLLSVLRRVRRRTSADEFAESLVAVQGMLEPGATYFGGDEPDTFDLQMFGMVQMFSSVPGQPLETLQSHAKLDGLRRWVEAMQRRYAHYAHLHSARDFEPRQTAIARAPVADRACFWLGVALMCIGFPISLPAVFFFVRRIRKKGYLPDIAPSSK